jgi:hypothetical protein
MPMHCNELLRRRDVPTCVWHFLSQGILYNCNFFSVTRLLLTVDNILSSLFLLFDTWHCYWKIYIVVVVLLELFYCIYLWWWLLLLSVSLFRFDIVIIELIRQSTMSVCIRLTSTREFLSTLNVVVALYKFSLIDFLVRWSYFWWLLVCVC